MLTTVFAGPYTVTGVSLGGVYTSLHIPQLDALLDIGMASRHTAATRNLFISHGHADHVGAIGTLMGIRGLHRFAPPRVFMPGEIEEGFGQALSGLAKIQRYDMAMKTEALSPGDERCLKGDMHVRAFRTHHPVPSLGYQFFRRVSKLKSAFKSLPGPEIARRKKASEDIFEIHESPELAYATDTLIRVLDTSPELLKSRVLIMECSFLDERKSLASSRAGCHIHLDEIVERADSFENEHIVLMHFSQLYEPAEIHAILQKRCPDHLWRRIIPFAPASGPWPV